MVDIERKDIDAGAMVEGIMKASKVKLIEGLNKLQSLQLADRRNNLYKAIIPVVEAAIEQKGRRRRS